MAKNLFARAEEMPEGNEDETSQADMSEDAAEGGEDEGGAGESEAYKAALKLAKTKLYEEGAGEGLMKAMQSAPSVGQALAEQTLTMMEMLDQMTNGSVPDEEVIMLGIELMGEVAEIAEAGGVQVSGREIASGMRQMLTGLVSAMGGDASEVEAAMAMVPDEQVGGVLDEQRGMA